MEKKKSEINRLEVVKNILKILGKNPKESELNNRMSQVAMHLGKFAKERGINKEAKVFFAFSKLFNRLYKKDLKNKAFFEVWFDTKEDKITKQEKTIYSVQGFLDFTKWKGENCRIIRRADGVISISVASVNLLIPKKYWKEYAET